MTREIRLLRPQLVIPVGKLAIEQLFPEVDKLTEVIGSQQRGRTMAGHTFDVIALPHPSGASTWHRTEPGKTLLVRALSLIAQHDAWQALVAVDRVAQRDRSAHARLRLASCHPSPSCSPSSSRFPRSKPAAKAAPATSARCASTSRRCCARAAPTT